MRISGNPFEIISFCCCIEVNIMDSSFNFVDIEELVIIDHSKNRLYIFCQKVLLYYFPVQIDM